MSFSPLFRLPVLAGLLALAPLFAEEAKPAPSIKLSDEDVRALLERNETAQWERTVVARKNLVQELERAKVKAAGNGVSSGDLKGFSSETPEQRKAKAEKLVKDTEEKIAAIDKTLGAMRDIAVSRVKAASYAVACPILPLPEALSTSVAAIRSAAAASGYKNLALAGVFVPAGGARASDPSLTDSLRAALTAGDNAPTVEAAPVFSGDTLKVATGKQTGVVVAEVLPFASQGGALWIVRLVDSQTFRIEAATVAFIPSEAALEALKKDYYARQKQPVGYEISVQDRRNFSARLGASGNLSFGVEGTGVDAALLRVALASRPTPAVNDFSFLAGVLGGPKTDSVTKALWVIKSGAKPGEFGLGSRLAGGRPETTVPVGEVSFVPVLPEAPKY